MQHSVRSYRACIIEATSTKHNPTSEKTFSNAFGDGSSKTTTQGRNDITKLFHLPTSSANFPTMTCANKVCSYCVYSMIMWVHAKKCPTHFIIPAVIISCSSFPQGGCSTLKARYTVSLVCAFLLAGGGKYVCLKSLTFTCDNPDHYTEWIERVSAICVWLCVYVVKGGSIST